MDFDGEAQSHRVLAASHSFSRMKTWDDLADFRQSMRLLNRQSHRGGIAQKLCTGASALAAVNPCITVAAMRSASTNKGGKVGTPRWRAIQDQ